MGGTPIDPGSDAEKKADAEKPTDAEKKADAEKPTDAEKQADAEKPTDAEKQAGAEEPTDARTPRYRRSKPWDKALEELPLKTRLRAGLQQLDKYLDEMDEDSGRNLKECNAKLKESIRVSSAQTTKWHDLYKEVLHAFQNTRASLHGVRAELTAVKTDLQTRDRESSALRQELAAAKTELEERNRDCQEAKSALEAELGAKSESVRVNRDWQQKNSALDAELAAAKADSVKRDREWQEEKRSLEEELAAAKADSVNRDREWQEEKRALEEELAAAKADSVERDREWQEEKRSLEVELAGRQTTIEGLRTERDERQRELDASRGSMKDLECRLREAERKLEEAVSAARDKAVPEGTAEELSELKKTLEEKVKRIEQLEGHVRELGTLNEDLREQLDGADPEDATSDEGV